MPTKSGGVGFSGLQPANARLRARSTRCAIFATDVLEDLPGRAHPAICSIVEALPDGFEHIGARRDVQQTLIGLGVLYHGLRFAVHGEDDRPPGLLELGDKLAGFAAECRERLSVASDIKHGA